MGQMRHWSIARGQLHTKKLRSNSAFSLVELMVAMTILSMLFLIAVPTYQRLQRKAKAAAIVTDLRVFATALQAHAHESGWPPDVLPGVVPTGMTPEEFKADDWTHPTPIGGQFDWENDVINGGFRYRAAITVVPTSVANYVRDDELLLQIDQAIDDGDLTKGNFMLGENDCPLFVIEK